MTRSRDLVNHQKRSWYRVDVWNEKSMSQIWKWQSLRFLTLQSEFLKQLEFWEIWRICMENIPGEQTLLAINIFHTNRCNFSKSQTPIKIHSSMPGASNVAILLISTRFFHLCHDRFFVIDKVTLPIYQYNFLCEVDIWIFIYLNCGIPF